MFLNSDCDKMHGVFRINLHLVHTYLYVLMFVTLKHDYFPDSVNWFVFVIETQSFL